MGTKIIKAGLLLVFIAIVIAFVTLDVQQYATLDYLKTQQASMLNYYQQHALLVLVVFALAYVLVTAFSLPVATAMTLLGGALFGFSTGLVVISFASSVGATLAFLMARFLLKDSLQKKYGQHLTKVNEGFAREGAFYLFALRLVPAVPFFVVNALMGLLPIRTRTFYWVSQLGMLPATAVYVYAGTELGKISSLSHIVSPSLLAALALLGLLPIAAKKALGFLRSQKT